MNLSGWLQVEHQLIFRMKLPQYQSLVESSSSSPETSDSLFHKLRAVWVFGRYDWQRVGQIKP